MPETLIPTIPDLIEAIDHLTGRARRERLAQLERALSLHHHEREVAMGLLALDLVTMDAT